MIDARKRHCSSFMEYLTALMHIFVPLSATLQTTHQNLHGKLLVPTDLVIFTPQTTFFSYVKLAEFGNK